MNEFKGNSDERMIELYQERIDGHKHDILFPTGWQPRQGRFSTHIFHADVEYRIRKLTRTINSIEVPMCMTVEPEVRSTYFIVDLIDMDPDIEGYTWTGDHIELDLLARGLLCFTLEDERATRAAILSGLKI